MKKLMINHLDFDIDLEIRDIYGKKHEIDFSPEESNEKWTGKRKEWGQIHSQLEIFLC